MPEIDQEQYEARYLNLFNGTDLSEREAETLAYKSFGLTAAGVAEQMDLAESTVTEYLNRARQKARTGKATWDALERFGFIGN